MYYHETLYRTAEVMERMATLPVTVCGAGALGANIVEGLARQGFRRLTVIDRDRVEERNLSTQPYDRADIGAQKAKMLANALYRAVGVAVIPKAEELTAVNTRKLLSGAGLVVDTFDNSVARRIAGENCRELEVPCLHVGLANGYGEVVWNERYRVPSDAQDDLCDYHLARNLVLLTVAVACETIVGFVADGERRGHTITLRDFAIKSY